MSSIENDFNSFAKKVFLQDEEFSLIVKAYPKIFEKCELVVQFYLSIDDGFNKMWKNSKGSV